MILQHPRLQIVNVLVLVGLLFVLPGRAEPDSSPGPSKEVIKKHLDPSVQTYGPYVAVKLPVDGNVPMRNPSVVIRTGDTIFGANYTGEIYRLIDKNGDGLEDTAKRFVDIRNYGQEKYPNKNADQYENVPRGPGLRYPTGMVFHEGWLYVATTQEIARFKDTDGNGRADEYETFASGWPYTQHYFDWTMGLRVGPDGWFYTNISTDYLNPNRKNDPRNLRGSMVRISPDGNTIKKFATGLRWAYDLDFNHRDEIFFTDNEGGGNSSEELNHAVKGGNYGHNPHGTPDGIQPRGPLRRLQFGAGSAGLEFNAPNNNQFGPTSGDLFVSMWGNDGQWNDGTIIRLSLYKRNGDYQVVEHPFSDGPPKNTDLCFGPDGSLYVARFGIEGMYHTPYQEGPMGGYYRFFFAPNLQGLQSPRNPLLSQSKRSGNPESGKTIFQERACSTCHTVDGDGGKIGPDLKGIGRGTDRSGLLETIQYPSRSIKTDFETYELVMKDGTRRRGRLLSANEERVQFRTLSNRSLTVPRSKVEKLKQKDRSLMPKGLLNGLSDRDVKDLVAYLESLDKGGLGEESLRVNTGGDAVVTDDGEIFLRDRSYHSNGYGWNGGDKFSANVPQALARTGRRGATKFQVDVKPGTYEVIYTGMETDFKKPKKRVFSIKAEGEEKVRQLDLVEEAGFKKMHRTTFTVPVRDGTLNLNLVPVKNDPLITAIEVHRVQNAGTNKESEGK